MRLLSLGWAESYASIIRNHPAVKMVRRENMRAAEYQRRIDGCPFLSGIRDICLNEAANDNKE